MRTSDMRRMTAAGLIVLAASCAVTLAAPPRVVKASPDNNATNVDPQTRQLRIEFDQPMNPVEYSVVGGGETFPRLIGKPTWINDRTFVWSIRLEPNKQYRLSINSDRFTNFRSKTGEAAQPYPISFRTAAGPAAAAQKLTVEDNRKAIAQLKRAIDEDYSYRDRLKVDWDKALAEAAAKLESATTPRQFATDAARVLAAAQDMHLWLKVGDELIPTYRRQVSPNLNMIGLSNAVPNWQRKAMSVYTGRFEDGIAYIMIASWANERAEDLDAAYAALADAKDAKALIIDVRPNGGGNEVLAQQFAGCFIDQPKVYSKNLNRAGGKFHGPFERSFQPNKARPAYRGKLAVLMGPVNMSSCESFLAMMKQVPACVLVGAPSFGSSGNPKPQELENGVTVFLPSWQDQLPDGTALEGRGITPDIEVKAERSEFLRGDPVLDAALKTLRSK